VELYLGAPFEHLNRTGNGYALAHEMDNNKIIETYRAMKNLILDNGADELGIGQKGSRLAYLAGRLQPNFIILPDVLQKEKKTRDASVEFYESMIGSGYHGKYMAVIQAKNLKSGIESYDFWVKSGIVDRIGITYDTKIKGVYSKGWKWGNRLSFLNELVKSKQYKKNPMGLHLLGTLEVQELYVLTHHKEFEEIYSAIESHDTTSPWACPTPFVIRRDGIEFGRQKDWTPQDFDAKYEETRLNVAYWNVAAYLTACKVPFVEWRKYLPLDVADKYSRMEEFTRHYE